MKFARILILLLLINGILPQASYANPDVPNAPSLAWDQVVLSTREGVDVWLRINVLGAGPTENVNLKFIYQTFGRQATPNDDYVPTAWPSGTKGTISGTDRVAYIKITIKYNDYYEPVEHFQVQLRSDSSSTTISGPDHATIYIARSRTLSPLAGIIESCVNGGEPNNNYADSAGQIAVNGGWCNTTFNNESVRAVDYYQVVESTNGTLNIRLENTTPDQHDLQLYVYYHAGANGYQLYLQSTNPNQQPETISAPIAANTKYLIAVYWATDTGDKIPTYRVSVSR